MKSKALQRIAVAVGTGCALSSSLRADSLVAVSLSNGDIDEYYVAKGTYNANATWSKVRTIANLPGVFGVSYNPADDCFYTTVVPAVAATARKITKMTRNGAFTDLAVRGTGTTGWTTADPQGIEIGPDGKLYFSTAFGGGTNGNGVFSLTTAGGSFTQLIPVTGSGFNLANSRDLIWSGGDLYVGSRNSNAVYRFNAAGTYQSSLTTTCTGASSLGIDGSTMMVMTNVAAPNSIRKIDNFATAPVLGQLTTTGKIGLEIAVVEGQRHYMTFNTGSGGAGDINRLNADGSSTVMVTFNTPTVKTANDFVAYPPVDSEPDGLPDAWEIAKLGDLTQNGSGNGDGDTLTNAQEYTAGTHPGLADTDGDGISDSDEVNRLVSGSPAPTNPTLADSDGDGLTDTVETNTGTFVSLADTGTNPLAADSDGDSFADYVEIARASNPSLAGSVPGAAAPTPIVSLNAAALSAGPLSSWSNGGGLGGSFDVETAATPTVQTIEGIQGVTFSGTEVLKGMTAPPVVTGNSARTITAWVYNPAAGTEDTIVSWGRRDGPNSTNSAFGHGTSATFGGMGQWGADADMPWGNDATAISQNVKTRRWTYLAYTYDPAAPRQGTLYADGVLARQETFAAVLATWAVDNTTAARPLPFRLAGNNAANGDLATTGVNGSLTIARLNILDRALSAAELGITDGDGDTIPAWWEEFYGFSDANTADAAQNLDGDNLSNLEEFTRGSNPNLGDTDGDGLLDDVETNTGFFASSSDRGTDPHNPDSDGDGLPDNVETGTMVYVSATNTGSDPNVADSDGDALSDGAEVLTYQTDPNDQAGDKDGDLLSDAEEVLIYFTNPAATDTDGDTFGDYNEVEVGSDPTTPISNPNDIPGYSGALVHRFKLDETAGMSAADSESAVTATIGSDVSINQAGRDGRSFLFPATITNESKVLIPSSVVPTAGNPFTMSAWIKLASPLGNTTQGHIISGNNGEAGRWNLGINDFDTSGGVDARLFWFHNGGVGTIDYPGFNFNEHIGEWVHVAVTRSANGSMALYLNGTGVNFGTSKATLNPGVGIALGSRPNALQFQFNGNIDDVRFHDGGLSPANVLALYQSFPPQDDYASWAAGFGLDPQSATGGPAGDADGDGTSNEVEFALGLSPVDGNKRFAITASGTPASGLTLTWPSAEGISFAVKSSTTLADWSTLEATVVGQAAQTTASWTAPASSGPRKFYRIEFTP